MEHSQRRENVTYKDRSRKVEYLLRLENKQQIMQNNVATTQSHVFVIYIYICSLCIVAFPINLQINPPINLHRDYTLWKSECDEA